MSAGIISPSNLRILDLGNANLLHGHNTPSHEGGPHCEGDPHFNYVSMQEVWLEQEPTARRSI
jgi:hypothetical protein